MRAIPIIGVAALALAACQAEDGATNNDTDVTTITEEDAGTTDPALTDLNMDAGEGQVDQAVDQTDNQANLDGAVDSAGNEI